MSAHAPRVAYFQLAPKSFKGLYDLSTVIKNGSLDKRLLEIVFLRVSQINGCAYCIDMHWADLQRQGMSARHVNAVAGWREAPYFSDRERAALRWAEIVTAIPAADPSDEEFARLKQHFNGQEIAELGFAIATITAWNLLNVSFRNPLPEAA
ncbi:carboxymuconolactone decarboxylase family protein [Caldimonas sp. KR1-144]|uniref:carboxymuconolactone decarboxylase family protein n=1 Tax=Caldimonas sp. KR1-144 TaxID=3400911 RepID=UPI003C0979FD